MIELKLHKPNYFLIPIDNSLLTEYSLGFSLGDIFKVKGCGILTAADELLINTKLDKLKSNIEEYIDNKSKLKLGSTVLSREKDPNGTYKILPYRAFDNRYYYDSKITARQKPELTKHESIKNNYYLGFSSTVRDNNEFQNVLITKNTPDVNFFTGKANTHSAPLYLKDNSND